MRCNNAPPCRSRTPLRPTEDGGTASRKRDKLLSLRTAAAFAAALSCAAGAQATFAGETQSSEVAPARVQSIEGGVNATVDDYPSIVALLRRRPGRDDFHRQFCGGTLIHPEWILTAAHCLLDNDGNTDVAREDLIVGLGITRLSTTAASPTRATTQPGGGAQFYGVAELHPHTSFDPNTLDNDIALLRLAAAASTGTAGAPPQIANVSATRIVGGVQAHIAGWGRTAVNIFPTRLQASSRLLTVGVSDCQQQWTAFSPDVTITDRMLCAHNAAREVDVCVGDSGGPLYVDAAGEQVQVGLVSFGPPCPRLLARAPGVYTSVSEFFGWIDQTAGITLSEHPQQPPPDDGGEPPPDSGGEPPPDSGGNPPPDSGGSPPPNNVDNPQDGGGSVADMARSGGGGGGGGCAALNARSKSHSADPLLWLLLLASTLTAALRLGRPTTPAEKK